METIHITSEPKSERLGTLNEGDDDSSDYLHSAFFKDCFFFDGFDITFILLELKTPTWSPVGYNN